MNNVRCNTAPLKGGGCYITPSVTDVMKHVTPFVRQLGMKGRNSELLQGMLQKAVTPCCYTSSGRVPGKLSRGRISLICSEETKEVS